MSCYICPCNIYYWSILGEDPSSVEGWRVRGCCTLDPLLRPLRHCNVILDYLNKIELNWNIIFYIKWVVRNPLTHLLISRRLIRKCVTDWPVDDVDDPVGCWQVLLDDGVQSAGIVHQDEFLHQPEKFQSQERRELQDSTLFCWYFYILYAIRKSYLVVFGPQPASSVQVVVPPLQILVEALTQDQVVFTHLLLIHTLQRQWRWADQ